MYFISALAASLSHHPSHLTHYYSLSQYPEDEREKEKMDEKDGYDDMLWIRLQRHASDDW